MARSLAATGHQVTGVDVSEVQIERARLVPAGTFVCADATQVTFPSSSFDAIVCLYALIHSPWPPSHSCCAVRPPGCARQAVGQAACRSGGPPTAMTESHAT
jgi:2-polyprenyl-3-methyl-5-hydroxy-6-metoxy-1,4-benzoquinol methylase